MPSEIDNGDKNNDEAPEAESNKSKHGKLSENSLLTKIHTTDESNIVLNFPKQSSNNFNPLKQVREHALASWMEKNIFASKVYTLTAASAVILALFLYDFNHAVLDKRSDTLTEIIIASVFCLLTIDLTANCFVYKRYVRSIYFWLDFVGNITILSDLSITYHLLGIDQTNLSVARGHRLGRVARSAALFRVSKIAIWARIVRLVRLIRLYSLFSKSSKTANNKTKQTHDIDFSHSESFLRSQTTTHDFIDPSHGYDSTDRFESESARLDRKQTLVSGVSNNNVNVIGKDKQNQNEQSAKIQMPTVVEVSEYDEEKELQQLSVGRKLADAISRDVVISILVIVMIAPLFSTTQEESYSEIYFAVDIFNNYVENSQTNDAISTIANLFLEEESRVCHLVVNNLSFRDTCNFDQIREFEKIELDDSYTSVTVDISEVTRFVHVMNMAYTGIIVVLFAIISLWIANDARKILLAPVETMYHTVNKMSKNVCLVANDFHSQEEFKNNEVRFVQAVLQKFSDILALFGSAHSGGAGNMYPLKSQVTKLKHHDTNDSQQTHDDPANDNNHDSNSCSMDLAAEKTQSMPVVVQAQDIAPIAVESGTVQFKVPAQTRFEFNTRDGRQMIVITAQLVEKKYYTHDKRIIKNIASVTEQENPPTFGYMEKFRKELSSIEEIMNHPLASQYFKHFCSTKLMSNRFNFIQSLRNYQTIVKNEYIRMYHDYVSGLSDNCVALDAKLQQELADNVARNTISLSSFQTMYDDSIKILDTHAYPQFMDSHALTAYLKHISSINATPQQIIQTIQEDQNSAAQSSTLETTREN